MSLQRQGFTRLYGSTASPESLPWHRERPPSLLERAVTGRLSTGLALDLGCGEGVSCAYLASRGWSVVAVDFVPAALELARDRLGDNATKVELVLSDVLEYETTRHFDLILDSGCLHHIAPGRRADYRARIEEWLLPGGDYVLVHFTKRNAMDWWPLGPQRLSRERILGLFPSLGLEAYEETFFELPPFMGFGARAGVFWFRNEVASRG